MILGKVVARVVSNLKHPVYEGQKLLLVRPVDVGGDDKAGAAIVAIDATAAGPGDYVLVSQEGKTAQMVVGAEKVPVRSVIVGIVDHWEENGKLHHGQEE